MAGFFTVPRLSIAKCRLLRTPMLIDLNNDGFGCRFIFCQEAKVILWKSAFSV